MTSLKIGSKGKGIDDEEEGGKEIGEYHWLPNSICAICYQKKELEEGNKGKKKAKEMIRRGIPNSDPLDPSSGSLINPRGSNLEGDGSNSIQRSTSTTVSIPQSTTSRENQYSPTGIPYSLTKANIPYECLPCKHRYCYVCSSRELLSEETGEEIGDDKEFGGWKCLRCNGVVREIRRWEGQDDDEEEEVEVVKVEEGEDHDGVDNLFDNEEDEELSFDVGEKREKVQVGSSKR